jgi:hypothetical protein
MVQKAETVGAQDRRDLSVFILVGNELKSNLICFTMLLSKSELRVARSKVFYGE